MSDNKREILTWKINDRLYGIDARKCNDVEKKRNILSVPLSNDYIVGIVNIRGDVVTVIDLRILMGYSEEAIVSYGADNGVLVRLASNTVSIAIQADAVDDVIAVTDDDIEAIPAHLSEQELKFIDSVVMKDDDLVIILDTEEIIKWI